MENELLNLLHDLVGDFPRNVKSNALEAAREYLAQVESGSTPVAPDECDLCGAPATTVKVTHYCAEHRSL